MLNLQRRKSNCCVLKVFVKMSTSYIGVWTYLAWISPFWIASRTKWQSTSICFVRSWKTGLAAICKAAWLSQCRSTSPECITPRVDNKPFNHFNSQVMVVMDLYSASAEDRDSICCFLVFQEIGEEPKRTK